MHSDRVGLFSRIDYGSEGFRQGLLLEMKEIFEAEDVGFAILLGGLISWRSLKNEMPKKKDVQGKKDFIHKLTLELTEKLPKMRRKNGDAIKIYIIPSPAYDGEIGEEVARKLAMLRKDIRFAGPGDDRFIVKGIGKTVWGVTPSKSVWMRGDFYSTPIQRVTKDLQKRSSHPLPDVYFIGGFGSSINKPLGEEPRPYVAVPVLHKIRETTVAENQVGVMVVEFYDKGHKVRLHSLKDLVKDDRKFVPVPEKLKGDAITVVNAIKQNGGLTAGLLADTTGLARNSIKQIIKSLPAQSEKWPGLALDEASKKFDFNLRWVQEKLKYNFSEIRKNPEVKEDRVAAFGCLHAGCVHTDYEFFLKDFPEYLIREDIDVLLGIGDFIEGLKHNLILRGEIYGAANNTRQEKLAAHMVALVLLKVFKERFDRAVKTVKKPDAKQIGDLVRKCMMEFRFIPGNHCLWSEDSGYVALDTFFSILRMTVLTGLQRILFSTNCPCLDITAIINEKIVESNRFQLPSGLKVELFHPHMSRTKTESIRSQEALAKSRDSHIVFVANFHVGIFVAEYNQELGERICLTVGTIKRQSGFEHNKLKTVDFGVGLLKVRSLNGRVFWAENEFFTKSSPAQPLDNDKIFDQLYDQIGLSQLFSL